MAVMAATPFKKYFSCR